MTKVLFKADLDHEIEELINNNLFGEEEKDVARVCLACLMIGVNKRKVRKLANCEKFDVYWSNLEKNHYFTNDGKIDIDSLDDDIPFVLMMKCADGMLERKEVGEVEPVNKKEVEP